MPLEYAGFLAEKMIVDAPSGIPVPSVLHSALKPFQHDLVNWALRRGRAAIFAGTGLGKTLQQLVWARTVHEYEDGPVLIFTPLAVAHQTVAEAAKFGIHGAAYAQNSKTIAGPIVVTNYDRMDSFDPAKFAAVVLDESSIIKSHDSKTRMAFINTWSRVPQRLCCTATPAPNDYVELGNHAEFLGVLSAKEMLSMFFVHDGSVRAGGGADWRLKRHAQQDFWRWLATWAAVVRSPRDLGYDEPGYDLPPLAKHAVVVQMGGDQAEAQTLTERIAARRQSIGERVAAAAQIVNAQPDRPWLVWCGLNDESTALVEAIPGAVEVRGSDKPAVKTDRLLGFSEGRYRVLVSKPSIAGFGMNWQHCADMVFVGLNDSFEAMFQAVRRCWRFGQTKPVNAYIVSSDLDGAVIRNVEQKERDFDAMCAEMAVHMRELTRSVVREGRVAKDTYSARQGMEIPTWLMQ